MKIHWFLGCDFLIIPVPWVAWITCVRKLNFCLWYIHVVSCVTPWGLECVWAWQIPSLKLTFPLKMDGWNTSFLLGWTIFRGYVSFRECNDQATSCLFWNFLLEVVMVVLWANPQVTWPEIWNWNPQCLGFTHFLEIVFTYHVEWWDFSIFFGSIKNAHRKYETGNMIFFRGSKFRC